MHLSGTRKNPGIRLSLWAIAITSIFLIACSSYAAQGQSAANDGANTHPADSDQVAATPTSGNLVELVATVRDKKGKIVPKLAKTDFVLTSDGSSQEITYFPKTADVPLTLGLVVDTNSNQRELLDQERNASGPFFQHTIREATDKGFVIHFDREVELLQDLTGSPQKLANGVSILQSGQPPQFNRTTQTSPPHGGSGPGQYPGRSRGEFHRDGTHLYDAIYLASNELMKKQSGRKVLVVISDGVDRGSKESLEYAIETAQRANTLIDCVYFKGEEQETYEGHRRGGFGGGMGPMGGGGMGRRRGGYPQETRVDGKKVLEQICAQSGGRMFEISKKLPLDQIYGEIQEDVESQYILGFTPQTAGSDLPNYHKIQLTVKRKGLVVQAREGYYSE